MRHLPLLALLACAEDPASFIDEAGPPQPLELSVSGISGGTTARLTARSLRPGQRVHFAMSTAGPGRTCPNPTLCVDLAQARLLGSAVANAAGYAELSLPIPAGVPDNIQVWVQALSVLPGGVRRSAPFERVTGGVMCPRIYMPVCGIDGATYSNDCELGAAGTFVDYSGPC